MTKKISIKALAKKLDVAWAAAAKRRARNRCEVCGKTESLNTHHYVSRSNKRLRWDLQNAVCACAGDHTLKTESFHKDPIWARNWMEDHREDDLIYLENVRDEIKKWTIEEMQDKLKELQNDRIC